MVSRTEQRSSNTFQHTCYRRSQEDTMLGYGLLGTVVVVVLIIFIIRAL